MKSLLFFLSLLIAGSLQAQTVLGKWDAINHKTGVKKCVVDIYEKEGKLYGKVLKIYAYEGVHVDELCKECPTGDARYMKPILGMDIVTDLQKDGDEYNKGWLLNPENGRIYECAIWLEGDELKVRGYFGPIYRTQTWKRLPK